MKKKRHREAQCYGTPLNDSFENRKDCRHKRNLVHLFGHKRLTRGMLQKLKDRNVASLSKTSRNSVIVINDSDSEITEENKEQEVSSLSVIECSPTRPSLSKPKSRKKELQNLCRHNKRRSSNLSVRKSSSTRSSNNGENIAPSQTEDDVIELWSSLKHSSSPYNRKKEKTKYSHDESNKEVNFVIDTRPNLKNLELLKIDTEPVRKRRKLCHHFDELTLLPNKSKKKNNNNNNTNSKDSNVSQSSTRSNAQSYKEEKNSLSLSDISDASDEISNQPSNHKLREIIVDGCNVAMAHTNHRKFSLKGIQLVVDYFTTKGHIVKVFLPQYIRKREYTLLEKWYTKGIVVFTPSRKIGGRQITSHDDRYILEYATACGGIVISTDQFRDWFKEKPEWRDTILNRLLTPTFVGDYVMFPEDPLGMFGPNLETFLRF